MGLFDKLKEQAQQAMNNLTGNQQQQPDEQQQWQQQPQQQWQQQPQQQQWQQQPQQQQWQQQPQQQQWQQQPQQQQWQQAPQTPPPAPQQWQQQPQQAPPPPPQQQWQQAPQTPPPAPRQAAAPQQQAGGGENGIYGDYIEHLIDMALADGELTEKEKQVLFKKAEAAGIDLDEFEMVLDARLFEKQKAMQAPQPQAVGGAAPKSDKYGDVKKCPSCGAMIESYTTKCPDCGYEFRNVESNASVQKLMKLLMEADEKSGGLGATVIGQMYGFTDKVVTRKKTIIANFPIPTTKEDIIEFLTIAVPQAKTVGNFFTRNNPALGNKQHNDLAASWKQKCEQIILKARFSMKDDPKTLAEIESYAKELNIK